MRAARMALLSLLLLPLGAAAQPFEAQVAEGFEELRAQAQPEEPALPALPEHVDISSQFAPQRRAQRHLNSCHAFAAVALMEAAYYRTTGERIRLSEADLFVRKNVLYSGDATLRNRDGGMVLPNLRFALETGVMPGDYYPEFYDRYPEFKKRPFKFADSEQKVLAALLPEALTEAAEAGRRKVKEALATFKARRLDPLQFIGSAVRTAIKNDAVSCRSKDHRRRALQELLAAGTPVSIGMLLDGAHEPWHSHGGSFGGPHYFVLTGYDTTPAGVVFHTRNSWGDAPESNPDVSEADLCALFGVSWLSSN